MVTVPSTFTLVIRVIFFPWQMSRHQVVLTDLRAPNLRAASLEPAEIAFGGPFIARGYLGRPIGGSRDSSVFWTGNHRGEIEPNWFVTALRIQTPQKWLF